MSERDGNVIDITPRIELREQAAKWREVAEHIASDEVALANFRTLMEKFVGHPDEGRRFEEGLPPLTGMRYGQEVSYPTEVCATIDTQGNVMYVREINDTQRWEEGVQKWYSQEQILERGKNHLAVTGNLFSDDGVARREVAQSRMVGNTDQYRSHRLQILPPNARNQPYLPIDGDMTFLPWQVEIITREGETSVRYVGEKETTPYRPIDGAFVDMVAESRMRQNQSQDALSS